MSYQRPDDSSRDDVVEYIPALRAFARTFCRQPEEADDLVQETLVKALSNLDKYEPGTRMKSWLFTIMRNTFCTKAKKNKRESVGIDDAMADRLVSQPGQEWSVHAKEVRRALESLPMHHREILVLVLMLGETYEDAAAICGCPIGTVKSRLNRARRQLLIALNETEDENLNTVGGYWPNATIHSA
ncbi:sigma-70 family RNA polymerase sigma factor [Rhizobium paknamense]|uniref:RNA polymerase sigma factor n=1 Tax=Rhizobium paknamense TaxID=1206817 RepID=A0ABU0IG08_9HYPH|nr:sigma-70 family RNA polymerase sigma factor [Rhizobium paknamense]MDQ0457184.1 RNA polymerase sigma-70 factor (ECF subfamily) [Rhizobium paknamense]